MLIPLNPGRSPERLARYKLMKKSKHFRSTIVVAASGLAAGGSQAAIIVTPHNLTLTSTEGGQISFDITDDSVDDYTFVYANGNQTKPQVTSADFGGGGTSSLMQIMMPDTATKVLPADLQVGSVVNGSLYGGLSFWEAFFFENFDQNAFGDWGGADPNAPEGPVEGYIALRIETGEGSGVWNYGYAHIRIDVPGGTMTVFETAYEDIADQAITIVPEPSVAALAAGACGLAALRRRRDTPH